MTMNIDVIALQEPAIINANCSIAARDWILVYPTLHLSNPEKMRSLMLINVQISMDSWNQLNFPLSNVTVIQFRSKWGKLMIFNVYNEGESNNTINLLTRYHRDNCPNLEQSQIGNAHIIWLGDFNRHHPCWDDPSDLRLFTDNALAVAEILIEAVAEAGLEIALPRSTPTHCHSVMKRWSRLDHIFISDDSTDTVVACDALTDHRGINTDHVLVLTELNLGIVINEAKSIPNFKDVDWDKFHNALARHLGPEQPDDQVISQRQLDERCSSIIEAIQSTICKQVPVTEITHKSKHWWTKELTQMRKQVNKLGRKSFSFHREPNHVIHTQHKDAAKRYDGKLCYAKKQHWKDWVERVEEPDIWMAN